MGSTAAWAAIALVIAVFANFHWHQVANLFQDWLEPIANWWKHGRGH